MLLAYLTMELRVSLPQQITLELLHLEILPGLITQGVSAFTNSPGTVNETDCKWVDSNNNLWLFREFDGVLWKYSIATNMWTWMKGTPSGSPVYGTLGTFGAGNEPGMFSGCPSVGVLYTMWSDSNNDLWMIVNRDGATTNPEIWKYSI